MRRTTPPPAWHGQVGDRGSLRALDRSRSCGQGRTRSPPPRRPLPRRRHLNRAMPNRHERPRQRRSPRTIASCLAMAGALLVALVDVVPSAAAGPLAAPDGPAPAPLPAAIVPAEDLFVDLSQSAVGYDAATNRSLVSVNRDPDWRRGTMDLDRRRPRPRGRLGLDLGRDRQRHRHERLLDHHDERDHARSRTAWGDRPAPPRSSTRPRARRPRRTPMPGTGSSPGRR